MNNNQEPIQIKLIVIGDGHVGKTSLLLTYTEGKCPLEYIPTVFENYSSITLVDKTQIQLSLWDTAGQESYSRLRVLSYQSASAFLIVFSLDDRNSFDNIWTKWIPELKNQNKENIPKIIVGNKCDIQVDDKSYYIQKCNEEQILYLETSAIKNYQITTAFEEIIRLALIEQTKKSILRSKIAIQKGQSKPKMNTFCQLL